MNRPFAAGVALIACCVASLLLLNPGHGQRPGFNTRSELSVRTTGERTTRQIEVLRLQREIDELAARVQRLERSAIVAGQIPPFSVSESEAAVSLAQLQLAETLALLEKGLATDVDVASSKLRLVRAESQLTLAHASERDGRLALQSEVAYAERRVVQETEAERQLMRQMAKGYSTIAGLESQKLDTTLARQALERALNRLKLFGADKSEPEPAPQEPPE